MREKISYVLIGTIIMNLALWVNFAFFGETSQGVQIINAGYGELVFVLLTFVTIVGLIIWNILFMVLSTKKKVKKK